MNCSNCGAEGPTLLRQVVVTRLRRPAVLYHCGACDFHGLADPPARGECDRPIAPGAPVAPGDQPQATPSHPARIIAASAGQDLPRDPGHPQAAPSFQSSATITTPTATAARSQVALATPSVAVVPSPAETASSTAAFATAPPTTAHAPAQQAPPRGEASPAPSWLAVAYEDAFYGDTGYVDRNLHAATLLRLTLAIGRLLGLGAPIGCDMGCGLGMLPRLLRDHGLDFWGSDEFAAMELIRPFCNPGPDLPIGCRTAFEVIEHVPDAAAFLRQQVGEVPLFVFSTLMRRDAEIPAEDWWYYAFGNGQHISFHSRRSFQQAMRRAGLDPASLISLDGPHHPRALHAIARDCRWRLAFRVAMPLANWGLAWLLLPWLEPLQGLRCRIIPDHEEAMRLKAERSAASGVAT